MKAPIKILQVITGLHFGGAETFLYTLVKNLDPNFFHCDVATVICGGELLDSFSTVGSKVTVLEDAYRSKGMLPFRIAPLLTLGATIREGRYDIVHTHLHPADVIGGLAAALAGNTKTIRSVHNMGTWKKRKHLFWERMINKRTKRIICCSRYMEEHVVSHEGIPKDKAMTIYHGIEIDRFSKPMRDPSLMRALGLDPEFKTIGCVGRLIPIKGHVNLIKAVPQILARHPRTQVLFIGDGEGRDDLINRVSAEEFRGQVKFVGSRSDIPELLSLMDIFVMPSLSEGLPVALIEAMAAGLPVVAFNIKPMEEIVLDGQTGILVEFCSSPGIAAACNVLLSDEPARRAMGLAGRKRAETMFQCRTMLESYQRLYRDVAREDPKTSVG